MGVLPLRRLAKAAGIAEPMAALLLEIAAAAGLIGELETSTETVFLPAAAYDEWRAAPLAQRWAVLAAAWLAMPRQPALVGQRDERDRPITALAPEVERAGAPALRRAALRADHARHHTDAGAAHRGARLARAAAGPRPGGAATRGAGRGRRAGR